MTPRGRCLPTTCCRTPWLPPSFGSYEWSCYKPVCAGLHFFAPKYVIDLKSILVCGKDSTVRMALWVSEPHRVEVMLPLSCTEFLHEFEAAGTIGLLLCLLVRCHASVPWRLLLSLYDLLDVCRVCLLALAFCFRISWATIRINWYGSKINYKIKLCFWTRLPLPKTKLFSGPTGITTTWTIPREHAWHQVFCPKVWHVFLFVQTLSVFFSRVLIFYSLLLDLLLLSHLLLL